VSRIEALGLLECFLDEDKCHKVFTPNPEIVMAANKDPDLMKALNDADLVVPDGIGVVLASKLTGDKLKERVAGCDLVFALFDKIKNKNYTVYFFGGAPDVAAEARIKMKKKFKGIKIVGVSDGYFDEDKEKLIIDDIKNKKPDILLVGLGAPKQEKWISEHDRLPVKVCIGVGGSFDIMSGKTKRAPRIFIKFGLEWFYRLITQPSRFFRMIKLPLFVFEVLKEKIFGR